MDYKKIPDNETIEKTITALKVNNINVTLVNNKAEALAEIVKIIPEGAKVLSGSSTTLIEIGYIDSLSKNEHQWNNLNAEVLKEPDMIKRMDLRRRLTAEADYFLSSVNAITEQGQLVAVDGTGSRVGAMPFVANKLIIVASANKIVDNLDAAFVRIKDYVKPLEDGRMMKMYNSHTSFGKWVIIEAEKNPERTKVILVKEALGF